MKKRVLSVLLTVCLLLALMPTTALAITLPTAEEYKWDAVNGTDYVLDTENSTLAIYTAKGAAFWSASGSLYRTYAITLENDINVSDFLWSPVAADDTEAFMGIFDGKGHTISGLTFNEASNGAIGLFGFLYYDSTDLPGVVKNLTLNGTITVSDSSNGYNYVGGIVGYQISGTIDHCTNNVNISVTSTCSEAICYAGGFVGYNDGGVVRNCANNGNISATSTHKAYAGGIIGFTGGNVKNCYNTGNIVASKTDNNYGAEGCAGGISGKTSSSWFINCYNIGAISGSQCTGGICGAFGSNSSCYWLDTSATTISGFSPAATKCGTFTSNTSGITAGTAENCGSVQALEYGTNLLDALNGWVEAQGNATDYYTWKIVDGINDGYPIFDTAYAPHIHVWDSAWTTDGTGHWHKCTADGCNIEANEYDTCSELGAAYATHTHDQTTVKDQTTLSSAATCTDDAVYFKTCVCGAISTTETHVDSGTVLNHDFTGEFDGHNETQHWHICNRDNCTATDTPVGHTPNTDDGNCTTDITCSACGTVTTEGAAAHTPNADDGNCTTDITCSVCGTVTTEGAASHTPEDDDGSCLTSVYCSVCRHETTAAEDHHTYTDNDDESCNNSGCTYTRTLTYTVTLNADGGTGTALASYNFGTGAALPTDYTKTGYAFAGWYDNEGFEGDVVTVIGADVKGNQTYYAKWTANTYTVSFNANGGEGNMENQEFTYGTAESLTPNTYTKDGFSFAGWSTTENGSVAYTDGQSVVNLTAEQNGTVTLYAVWTSNPILIGSITGSTATDVTATLTALDGTTYTAAVTGSASPYNYVVSAPAGNYQLVVTATVGGKTITVTSAVALTGNETKDIVLPVGEKNSVVDNTAAGDYDAIVDGLDELAKKNTDANSDHSDADKVEVKLTVTAKTEDGAPAVEVTGIKAEAKGKTLEYIDLKLEKTVNGTPDSDIGSTNTVLLTIEIPFTKGNRQNITVYRYHGAAVDVLTTTANSDGEYIAVGGNSITIYAKKFSTYAIGYTIPAPPPVYIEPTYTVTGSDTDNGKITVSRKYAYAGNTVKVTVTPDEGYVLDSLTVTDSKGNSVELTDKGDGSYTFKMPYRNVTVTAVFVEEPCDRSDNCPAARFTDLDLGLWYHDGIHYCVEHDLISGYPNNLFGPNDNITRGQIVTILWRLEGSPEAEEAMVFTDVAEGKYYAEAVRWAAGIDVVGGYDNGLFGPDDAITREQLASILWRYAKYKGVDVSVGENTNILSYKDALSIHEYAIHAMQWACGAEILQGYDGNLMPTGTAARSHAAAMLQRYCELVK